MSNSLAFAVSMSRYGLLLASVLLATPVLVRAADAETFVQRFEATFASPEAAARATVTAAELPPGKAFSLSFRWDDANRRHLKMADVLDPLGLKATFYINSGGAGRDFVPVMTNLLARGHSIGNHTVSHPLGACLAPVALFREITDCRIALETQTQSPVSAFSVPYGNLSMRTDPDALRRCGEALANSGLLGSPQSGLGIAAKLNLDPSRWIGTHFFAINDTNPDAELFRRGMNAATNSILRGEGVEGPHVTMGTHTWQSDEGFKKLSGILSCLAGRKDIWFVNENEWIAFRVQQKAARFRRVSLSGARAVYEVTRPESAALGADMPLYLTFSERPVAVRAPEAPQRDVLSTGLAAGPAHALPRTYRLLPTGALAVDASLARFTLMLRNDTQDDWCGGVATLRLPPGFTPGTVAVPVGSVRAGETKAVSFASRRSEADGLLEGDFFAAVQVDVRGASGPARLWVTVEKKRPLPLAPVPRDTCRAAGPFLVADDPGEAFFAGLSRPDAALADFAGKDGVWRRVERLTALHPSVVKTSPPRWRAPDRRPRAQAFAYGIEADVAAHGAKWRLDLFVESLPKGKARIFLNGRPVAAGEPLELVSGRNRMLVVHEILSDYNFQHEIAIVSEKDAARAVFRAE